MKQRVTAAGLSAAAMGRQLLQALPMFTRGAVFHIIQTHESIPRSLLLMFRLRGEQALQKIYH